MSIFGSAVMGGGSVGPQGPGATIAIGTVTTGAPGSSAAVTNVGTAEAALFDMTIPRGDTGAGGTPGLVGPPGQASTGAVMRSGATPAAADTDMVWPPTGNLLSPAATIIAISTVCRKNSNNTIRTQEHRVHVRRDGSGFVVDGNTSPGAVSGAGWAGKTTFAFAAFVESGRSVLRIVANGPSPSSSACTWDIKGAYISELDRALV